MKLLNLTIAAILIAFSTSFTFAQITGRLYIQTFDYFLPDQGVFGYISYPNHHKLQLKTPADLDVFVDDLLEQMVRINKSFVLYVSICI